MTTWPAMFMGYYNACLSVIMTAVFKGKCCAFLRCRIGQIPLFHMVIKTKTAELQARFHEAWNYTNPKCEWKNTQGFQKNSRISQNFGGDSEKAYFAKLQRKRISCMYKSHDTFIRTGSIAHDVAAATKLRLQPKNASNALEDFEGNFKTFKRPMSNNHSHLRFICEQDTF